MKRTVLALPFALALAACVDAPETGVDEAAVVNGDGEACPKLGCSSNSAFLGPTEFHELEETGTYESNGLYLRGLVKNGVTYRPDVTGTVLVGWRFTFVGGLLMVQQISGSALVGAELVVKNADGSVEYRIRIASASTSQRYWQAPTEATINTYELNWQQVKPMTTDFVPVCTNPPNAEVEDGSIANRYEAILFAGDRYDTRTLTVTASTPAEAGNWFNIACAGNVMAKLALNRHTSATASSQVTTTKSQRQAMLKMYTGDFCGTGSAFTVSGTPIRWWSNTGLTSKPIPLVSKEAFWDEDGALCLDVYRLHGAKGGAALEDQLKAACTLSACTSAPTGWYLRTESQATP